MTKPAVLGLIQSSLSTGQVLPEKKNPFIRFMASHVSRNNFFHKSKVSWIAVALVSSLRFALALWLCTKGLGFGNESCAKPLNLMFTVPFLSLTSCWLGGAYLLELRLFRVNLLGSCCFAVWCFIKMCYSTFRNHTLVVPIDQTCPVTARGLRCGTWCKHAWKHFCLLVGNFYFISSNLPLSPWNSFPNFLELYCP